MYFFLFLPCHHVGSSSLKQQSCLLKEREMAGPTCQITLLQSWNIEMKRLLTQLRASQVAQIVKNLPAMQETRVWSLCWADPRETRMATHTNILAWRITWWEEHGRLQSMGLQRLGHNWMTNTFTLYSNNFPYPSKKELETNFLKMGKIIAYQ